MIAKLSDETTPNFIRERLRTHKVPEFSYSLTRGILFVFVVFFVYNFLQLYKDIYVYSKEICSP